MKQCHDCAVEIGEQHKPGCDMEECPFCGGQLIGCDCCYEKLGIDANVEPVYSQWLNEEQATRWEAMLKEKGYILYGNEKIFF